MIHRYLLLLVSFVFLASCHEKNEILHFEVINNADFDRVSVPVSLAIEDYFRGDLLVAENLSLYCDSKKIHCQFIDNDQDGYIDELFFQPGLKKYVTKKYILMYDGNTNAMENVQKMTNVRFVKKEFPEEELRNFERLKSDDSINVESLFLFGGPAWENENLVFNNKYNNKNIIYAMTKKDNELILDDIIIGSEEATIFTNYMNSLDVGGLAMMFNTDDPSIDTVYRIDNASKSNYKLICDGPLKSKFEHYYMNWIMGSNNYNLNHKITISGGTHYYESEVTATGVRTGDKLVVGLSDVSGTTKLMEVGNHVLFASEYIIPSRNEYFSMGILVNKKYFDTILNKDIPTVNIDASHLLSFNLNSNKPVKYRVYVVSDTVAGLHTIIDIMEKDVFDIENPFEVKVISDL